MACFICPHCKVESEIFAASTGGAAKMCSDYKLKLLGRIPLDPVVVKSCDIGKYIGDEVKESKVLDAYKDIGKG